MNIFKFKKDFSSPLFLLGSGRSGTTLLQRILNSHEDICIWGEHGGFLSSVAEAYIMSYDKVTVEHLIKPNKEEKSIKEAKQILKNPTRWIAWQNWFGRKSIIKNFRNFVESFFNPNKLNTRYWGFKEIRYGFRDKFLGFAREVFPEAKFIFIIRNPIDVLASQIVSFRNGNKDDLIKRCYDWVMQTENFLRFKKNFPNRVFLIKFEDLVKNPEDTLYNLFDFLNLKVSQKQFEVILLKEGRGESKKKLNNIFTEEELRDIKDIVGSIASEIGYKI